MLLLGLIARKCGMTRLFTEDGFYIPVTVLDVSCNYVTQVKKALTDGYSAVQVGFGSRRPSRVSKAVSGHLSKVGVAPVQSMVEFRVSEPELDQFSPGSSLSVDLFSVGQKIDVSGVTIGKGFAGCIKRHGFSSNRASHGNSISHRAPGSIGMNQDPGRVFPGKRMAGHMGAVKRTVQNLEVVKICTERQLIWVRGAVPGHAGGQVIVRPAVKAASV